MSAPNLFPTLSLNRSFGPCDLCGISRFSGHFSGTCGKTGGGWVRPRKRVPRSSPVLARPGLAREPSAESRKPSVGFLAFPGISLGRVGKPGVGVPEARCPKPGARSPSFPVCGISRFSSLFSGTCGKTGGRGRRFIFLDDFRADSAARAQISALGTRNSELVYQLATFNLQLTTVFSQVTWAYFADSIESYKKLRGNNRRHISELAMRRVGGESSVLPLSEFVQ
jgi:hypothetical protein